MASNPLNNTTLLAVGITMAILTTTIFAIRMYLGVVKQRRFSFEDGWLIAAWAVFIVVTVLYCNAGEVIFRLQALEAGELALYPTVADDGLLVQKTFFVTTSGLWICLWLVKASLLSLYKRLINNVKVYLILWWVVVVICVVVCYPQPYSSTRISRQPLTSMYRPSQAPSHRQCYPAQA